MHLIVDDFRAHPASPYSKVAQRRVQEVKARYGSRITARCLEDKIHNMTVLADAAGNFREGLYFRRESKTTQVSPVYLHSPQDLVILKNLWNAMSRETKPIP